MTIALAVAAKAQTSDVALGIEALARRDVKGAEAAFRRATTADNPLIRPTAWQWLGHVAWKFRGDTTSAIGNLARALAEARDSTQVLLERARLNGARGRHVAAVKDAHAAMSRSLDSERRGIAARTAVELLVDAAYALEPGGIGPRSLIDSVGPALARELRDTLASRVRRFHGRTSDALGLMNVGALLGDTASVTAGLQSYFALVDAGLRVPFTASAGCGSGVFDPCTLWVMRMFESSIHRNDVSGFGRYGRLLHDTRKGIEVVYRVQLAGRARPGDVTRFMNGALHTYWRDAGKRTAFVPGAAARDMSRRFGAMISVERGRGMDELFFAHRLATYEVDGAPVVVLDGVVSSGIDDWFLDGTGGRAGWVANDTIYMRRTGFTETPFRALLALTDPQTMPGELFRITRDSIGDVDRARRDSLGYFPGVAARMFRSGAQALLDSLQRPELFTRAMYDNLVHTSIHLHESRHLTDARSGRQSNPADDEFRAKLDEVTGARLPRLALTAILSPNIGDASPHGQANRRIMIGLNQWIRRNGTASVAGYDPRVPALLQLPLLTDVQLKAAFNSMRAR